MKQEGVEEMKKMVYGMMVIAMIVAIGCSDKSDKSTAKASVKTPKEFVSEKQEGTPTPIPEARALAAGSEVVLEGLVMGVKDPFVDGRAAFVLGDQESLTVCVPERCATIWDACCDLPEEKIKGTATVQIVDESGKVLSHGLKDVGGLKELSSVRVVGTVAPNSSKEAFIVNAKSVYVEPGKPEA